MWLTLTLTPDAATASVLIQITGGSGTLPATVIRTDANGSNPVRLRDGQGFTAGSLTVVDAEAALTGPITYTARSGSGVVFPDNGYATTTLDGLVSGSVVTGVQLPQLAFRPQVVTGYEAARESSSTVHRPIGRDEPVVIFGPTRLREGTLTMYAADLATARNMVGVLSGATRLMLRQPDHAGMDMYFAALRSRVTPDEYAIGGWRWAVECDYVETRSPALPLLGTAGWTYGSTTAAFSTYAATGTALPTYALRTVGVV
ncbi:MAG: hypothetical protein IE926_05715 [Micrococcales bacterium]|nr:hypothetical protein [Micrococcales bacterium]